MQQLHAIIHGKVQGVWFRAWTRDTAREMGVTGWVRNMENGNVEVVAQGADEVIRIFLEKLYDGPPLARVTKIDSSLSEAGEQFGSFEVRA